MKKYLFILVIAVANVATANKTADTAASNIVYYVNGCNEYHTSAFSAHLHSGNGTMMMQRESGCKQSGMHKCLLCKGSELIANIK